MLEAGVHSGHQTRFWRSQDGPVYLRGHRNKIHIINLEKTLPAFNERPQVHPPAGSQARHHPMVGTKRQAAKSSPLPQSRRHAYGRPALARRHVTNFRRSKTSLKNLKDMQAQIEAGTQPAIAKGRLMFQERSRQARKEHRRYSRT